MRELTWTTDPGRGGGYRANADHGVLDEKGRRVGGVALLRRRPAGDSWHGGEWELYVWPTRDGRRYGATSPPSFHSSELEAHLEAGRRLDRQAASYQRKYGHPGAQKAARVIAGGCDIWAPAQEVLGL